MIYLHTPLDTSPKGIRIFAFRTESVASAKMSARRHGIRGKLEVLPERVWGDFGLSTDGSGLNFRGIFAEVESFIGQGLHIV